MRLGSPLGNKGIDIQGPEQVRFNFHHTQGVSDQTRHCEDRRDEAIYTSLIGKQHGFLPYARNDKVFN